MSQVTISKDIKYIGCNDYDLDLFESQYVIPNGVSYNSYVIFDEKIAVMDTVDKRKSEQWFENLEITLGDKKPDYLIIQHMEPDHSANIENFLRKYPDTTVVGNAKTFPMISQFFDMEIPNRLVVKESDELILGSHTLKFFMAPMVHWPEVMVTFEMSEGVLFSADGFGKFGALDIDEDWTCEARRYYFNIVGKYGAPVQALLKKAATLDIKMICPLHGPILKDNLGYYIGKYDLWSSYKPENKGILIAYASIHGNTAHAAKVLAEKLEKAGAEKVIIADLSREDMSEVIEDAFRYDRMVLMASSYDAGVFPVMEDFLCHLRSKNYNSRKVALIENGSWAPSAGKVMMSYLENMTNLEVCNTRITIRSTLSKENIAEMNNLVTELVVL